MGFNYRMHLFSKLFKGTTIKILSSYYYLELLEMDFLWILLEFFGEWFHSFHGFCVVTHVTINFVRNKDQTKLFDYIENLICWNLTLEVNITFFLINMRFIGTCTNQKISEEKKPVYWSLKFALKKSITIEFLIHDESLLGNFVINNETCRQFSLDSQSIM